MDDTRCRLMTHVEYKGMLRYKMDQAKDNRQMVLDAVKELTLDVGNAFPPSDKQLHKREWHAYLPSAEKLYKRKYVSNKEIEKYLIQKTNDNNQKIREKADMLFQEGWLTKKSSGPTEKRYEDFLSLNCKEPIDLRSIQRWTKALTDEGLLTNKHFGKEVKFTLTDVAMTDIRYFAQHFGYLMFQELIRSRDLELFYKTMSGKVKELVTLYGSYMLFCLIEASKPVDEDFVNKFRSSPVSAKERDKVAALWIEDAINPFWMFRHFLDVIQGHPGDGVLQQLSHLKYKENRKGKAVYVDERGNEHIFPQKFYPDKHLYIDENGKLCQLDYTSIPYPTEASTYSKSKVIHSNYEVKGPYYEIDKEKIEALTRSFKKLYPDIYRRLSIRDIRGEKNNLFRAIPEL
jgi:hypothetical protein